MNEEKFEQLRKLMAIKRYEQPSPGYFDRLPGQIIAALEAERTPRTWFHRIWFALQAKPAFAGAFGLVTCVLVVGGVFVANRAENSNSNVAVSVRPEMNAPKIASSPTVIPSAQRATSELANTEVSSTNPLASTKGLENFFNGSLVSSGAFPNVERTLPVTVPLRPR
jgi:hypothetical protein